MTGDSEIASNHSDPGNPPVWLDQVRLGSPWKSWGSGRLAANTPPSDFKGGAQRPAGELVSTLSGEASFARFIRLPAHGGAENEGEGSSDPLPRLTVHMAEYLGRREGASPS